MMIDQERVLRWLFRRWIVVPVILFLFTLYTNRRFARRKWRQYFIDDYNSADWASGSWEDCTENVPLGPLPPAWQCIPSFQNATASWEQKQTDRSCLRPPKIYVYPTPPEFELNLTDWPISRRYFRLETEILRGLEARGRMVKDPEQADVFWIKHTLVRHWIGHGQTPETARDYYQTALRPLLRHIYYDLPYFNASNGRNHILVYTMDNGPVCEVGHHADEIFMFDDIWKKVVHRVSIVGYWGLRGVKADPLAASPFRLTCWNEGLDIAVPQFHNWKMTQSSMNAFLCIIDNDCNAWVESLQQRSQQAAAPFFFYGNFGAKGHKCSQGIRPWVKKFCQNNQWCSMHDRNMQSAVFALCPAGWGCWSSRQYDALENNAIPVILSDEMVMPFENQFDWSALQEQVETGNPVKLPKKGVPQLDYMAKLACSWVSACRDINTTNDATATEQCIRHPVSQRMANIAINKVWFSWSTDSQYNVFAMFERELLVRGNDACKYPFPS